jgi:hypothetical protein
MFPSKAIILFTIIPIPFFFILENYFILKIIKKSYLLNNWYINFHRKIGMIKVMIFKSLFLSFEIYSTFTVTLRPSDSIMAIWVYYLVVIYVLLKYFTENHGNSEKTVGRF